MAQRKPYRTSQRQGSGGLLGGALESWGRGVRDRTMGLLSDPGGTIGGLLAQEYGFENPSQMTVENGRMALPPGMPVGMGAIAGTFGGKLAKTADLDMLDIAKQAEQGGMTQERIFDATGWFKGADGQWRFEMDDSAATVADPVASGELLKWPMTAQGMNAADLYKNQHLYDAYPQLADTPVGGGLSRNPYEHALSGQGHGSYNPFGIDLTTYPGRVGSTMSHELQHGVQGLEGFASGGSPEVMREIGLKQAVQADKNAKRLESLRPLLRYLNSKGVDDISGLKGEVLDRARNIYGDDAIIDLDAMLNGTYTENGLNSAISAQRAKSDWAGSAMDALDRYKRLAGEVEARNTQARLPLTPDDRRMLPPWLTQDTPFDEQIVKR